MPNYNIKISNGDRNEIISYISDKKKQGKFSVVDVVNVGAKKYLF